MTSSKRDALYDDILERLITGRYRFGDRILVKELAQETGASRQPIMAALNALSSDGLVRIIPQVGCAVIDPTLREISDFYQMFARLEGVLAALAAARGAAAQVRVLVETNRQIATDVHDHGGAGYRQLNRQFHATYHQMADSPLLVTRQSSIFAMSDFFIMQTVGFAPHLDEAIAEHDAIIAAIEANDAEAARAAAEAHIDAVAAAVLAGMEGKGDDPASVGWERT